MNHASPLSRIVEVVKAFSTGRQLSTKELADLLACNRNYLRRHLELMHDAGLLRVGAWRKACKGPYFPVYEWAHPFGAADAPRPTKAAP